MGNAHCTCSNDNDTYQSRRRFSISTKQPTYLSRREEGKKLMQNSWNRTWVTSKRTRFVGYLNCELNAELLDGCHHRQLSRIKHTHVHVHIYGQEFIRRELWNTIKNGKKMVLTFLNRTETLHSLIISWNKTFLQFSWNSDNYWLQNKEFFDFLEKKIFIFFVLHSFSPRSISMKKFPNRLIKNAVRDKKEYIFGNKTRKYEFLWNSSDFRGQKSKGKFVTLQSVFV